MKNLKKKISILLFSILSLFIISFIVFFNTSIYLKEYNDIKDKMKIFTNPNKSPFNINNNQFNPIIMDNEVYEVSFNSDGSINKINSYTQDGLSDDDIKKLIKTNNKIIVKDKIGVLYFDKYLFKYNRNGNLLIINNESTRNYLLIKFFESIILLIALEIINILSCLRITKWLVKPVEESFEKQREFIYDASHELKTPIAIIRASAETLEHDVEDNKWLENIKTENDRMNKLVVNLLDLSKSENIKEKENFEDVNLSKIIMNKSMSFESLMYENNLKLVTNIDKDIHFKCNADRIKELLSILIDNAIKHALDDSKITVTLTKDKNNILLSVMNRGEEIPTNEREKIFERFYRIDKARNRNEGRYGLGLSIAKNIVNSHNGNIKVDCNDGYTTFTVLFKQN